MKWIESSIFYVGKAVPRERAAVILAVTVDGDALVPELLVAPPARPDHFAAVKLNPLAEQEGTHKIKAQQESKFKANFAFPFHVHCCSRATAFQSHGGRSLRISLIGTGVLVLVMCPEAARMHGQTHRYCRAGPAGCLIGCC